MNRAPLNSTVLGAGKNASFALFSIRQVQALVGDVRLSVTKYITFTQEHVATATISLGRRLALSFSAIHEQVSSISLALAKRINLSFVDTLEQTSDMRLSQSRSLAFVTDMEHVCEVPLRCVHMEYLTINTLHEHTGTVPLLDLYTGGAPLNRTVGIGASDRVVGVPGS